MTCGFADRLNELISDTGMKKVQFAQAIKVDQSYISQMISGKRTPSDRVIDDICRVCGVNKEWLCDGTLPKKSLHSSDSLDAIADSYNLSPLDRDILKGFLELDDVRRSIVLDMMRGLIDSSGNK
jgi:transcriptional regulator with XRE-family HTH domain